MPGQQVQLGRQLRIQIGDAPAELPHIHVALVLYQQVVSLGQRDSAVEYMGTTGPARLGGANGQVKEAIATGKKFLDFRFG